MLWHNHRQLWQNQCAARSEDRPRSSAPVAESVHCPVGGQARFYALRQVAHSKAVANHPPQYIGHPPNSHPGLRHPAVRATLVQTKCLAGPRSPLQGAALVVYLGCTRTALQGRPFFASGRRPCTRSDGLGSGSRPSGSCFAAARSRHSGRRSTRPCHLGRPSVNVCRAARADAMRSVWAPTEKRVTVGRSKVRPAESSEPRTQNNPLYEGAVRGGARMTAANRHSPSKCASASTAS